ncbi:MAG: putative lipid II flippase FtsW [Lachnospiraceae bacterium]|nr:putative lipid II flippase FtsW [Lachnospiraceae bacterium]
MANDKTGKKKIKYFDYTLLFVIIFLLSFGLVMLYSSSSYAGMVYYDDAMYYLKRQGVFMAAGFIGMMIVSFFSTKLIKALSPWGFIGSVLLCYAVLFVGTEHGGSRRWLEIGPLSFQPSELLKFAVIIYFAAIVSAIPKGINNFKILLKLVVLLVVACAPVAVTNTSTAIIIAGIAVSILFVASKKWWHYIVLGAGGIAVFALSIFATGYRSERIQIWQHPEDFDKGYQTLQGLYAIGSGGTFGKGLGNSMQKLGSIPDAQNDMIFSIICEELGLFGAICVILLYGLMIYRFLHLAVNAKDLFGSLIMAGIFTHISLQVFINIAVVTNFIPNTGATLPFISYGGTALLILMAEMGVALAVSRSITLSPGDYAKRE